VYNAVHALNQAASARGSQRSEAGSVGNINDPNTAHADVRSAFNAITRATPLNARA
jgi:hypothetical protein